MLLRIFDVKLTNLFDNSSPANISVSLLGPNSSVTLAWSYTTPPVVAWCPMKVEVDVNDDITESNEFDNTAIRPFVNGEFALAGGIDVTLAVSPYSSEANASGFLNVSGLAEYFGTPISIPTVAGAEVTMTVLETGAEYKTITNENGLFSRSIPKPALPAGTYEIKVEVTDFTLTGNDTADFVLVDAVCHVDLIPTVQLSANTIVEGESITGTVAVNNLGCADGTAASNLRIELEGQTPAFEDHSISSLNAGDVQNVAFGSLTYNTPGVYRICGIANQDFGESAETGPRLTNNRSCKFLTVLENKPDLVPYGGPGLTMWECDYTGSLNLVVRNTGAADAGAFDANVYVSTDGGGSWTLEHTESLTGLTSGTSNQFSVAYSFSSYDEYQFRLDVDLPDDVVMESNESNNSRIYVVNHLECKPDLIVVGCPTPLNVNPVDPHLETTVDYEVTVRNKGNAVATAPFDVEFSSPTLGSATVSITTDLNPNDETTVVYSAAPVDPALLEVLQIAVDGPSTLVDELNENNNSASGLLCYEFQPVKRCVEAGDFWRLPWSKNDEIYFSVAVASTGLYEASEVEVEFEVLAPGATSAVSLGRATGIGLDACGCPTIVGLTSGYLLSQNGTYVITMTVDPDDDYVECNDGNNVMVRSITISDDTYPDMRILSQHIQPSDINPSNGEDIFIDVTYENIGASNVSDQMDLKVLVDEIQHGSSVRVNGLVKGDNFTVNVPPTWDSNINGVHIIRAIIDAANEITEGDELNNEATKSSDRRSCGRFAVP